jgi:hypothetical protein
LFFRPLQVLIGPVKIRKYLNLAVCILLRVSDQVQGFPSNATLFQKLFTILFKLTATRFGRTTIFKRKYIHLYIYIYMYIYTCN